MTTQRYSVTYKLNHTGDVEHVKWAKKDRELASLLARMILWDDEVTFIQVHDCKEGYLIFQRCKA